MTLGIRKGIVLGVLGSIFLLANAVIIASWLEDHGWIDWAKSFREEFLTGTAITITVTLLILLVPGRENSHSWFGRCPTCHHLLLSKGKYCSECGSKI